MASAMLWFVLGLVLLALGGDSIVKSASGFARHLRWSPFATGLVLVALATSIPELAVNWHAVAAGRGDMALGNAVGSNIANIGLTLALAAIAAPLVLRWRALSPLLIALLLTTVVAAALSLDGRLGRVDGVVLLGLFVAGVLLALRRTREDVPEVRTELEAYTQTSDVPALNGLRLALGLAFIGGGAWLVVRDAPVLGQALGLSPLLTGLLPVAIGTALPEVAGAIGAARRGQGDLVAGHVLGSSLVNLSLVLGGMALLSGGLPIPASFVRLEWPAAFVFALMLLPILRGDMRVSRGEGQVLLLAFVAWVAFEVLKLAR